MSAERTSVHLAFHYLGCATWDGGRVNVPSRVGALLETVADAVDHLTVVAYDPPASPGPEDGTEYVLERSNVSVCSLGAKGTYRDRRSRRGDVRARMIEASRSFDVLMLQLPNRRASDVFDPVRTARIATMIVGHTPTVVASGGLSLRTAVARTAAAWAERQYSRIIAASGATFVNSDELAQLYGGGARALATVPLSARRERFSHRASDRMDGGEIDLMICGRIAAEKGVFDALDAFISLRSGDMPHARLNIVGDGPDAAELWQRAEAAGVADGVVMHGWVPAGRPLFDIFKRMDVLLLPSYAEGLPYAVWEALAHSVLVVCTPVGGLKHAFSNEREVLFVSPSDPGAITEAVMRLASDQGLRERLLREGYDRSRSTSLESVVATMLETFFSVWTELGARS